MERPRLPVVWEVRRNAGGVRPLEWEGADGACWACPGVGRQCGRARCHPKAGGTVEVFCFQLGNGIVRSSILFAFFYPVPRNKKDPK